MWAATCQQANSAKKCENGRPKKGQKQTAQRGQKRAKKCNNGQTQAKQATKCGNSWGVFLLPVLWHLGVGKSARALGRASSFENGDLKALSHCFLRVSTSCYNHVCLWVEDYACPTDASMLFAHMPLKWWTMSGRRCFHIPTAILAESGRDPAGRKNQILHILHGAQTEAKQQTHGGIELEWQCKPNLTDWKTLGGNTTHKNIIPET